jgi:transcriptional regulator with XRE-family HTH domain
MAVAARQSPTVRRRRLGLELRRLREAAGLTIEKVADRLECSDSKVSRIETGQVGATPRDVRDMLELYGVTGEQRDGLVQIAREAREKGWWHAYGDVQVTAYIGFEAEAAWIRTFEVLAVPGLLQTPAYARAVIRAARPNLGTDELERWTELRRARQALLAQDEPPTLWAVLDEAVLRRQVGGRGAMREQLLHLADAAAAPNVTLQVLPFAAGEHAGMSGAFTIFRVPESADPDVVHLENATSDLYLEREDELDRYSRAFEHLSATALHPAASVAALTTAASEL